MAWTAPRTYTAGELITKAILDTHVRDNLNALKTPPSSNYEVNEASDYTTTSTSFVDVDATNLALTIVTAGGDVMIGFHGTVDSSSGSHLQYYDIDVDGARNGGDDGIAYVGATTTQADDKMVSFVRLITGLSAASHTFKLQWKVSAGTGRLLAGAASAAQDVHPQLWAREVS